MSEWNEKAANAIPVLHFLSYIASANTAVRKGEWIKAIGFTDKALASNLPQSTRAMVLEIKVRPLLESKKYDQVEAILIELDMMQRISSALFELRGRFLADKREHDKAVEVLRQGISLYPTNGTLRALLLRSLYALGKFEEESELINEIFESLPQVPWEYSNLFIAMDKTQHYEESQRLLRIARDLYPDKEDFRIFEAVRKVEKGDFASARELVRNVKGPMRKIARMIFYFELISNQIVNRVLRLLGKKSTPKPPTLN